MKRLFSPLILILVLKFNYSFGQEQCGFINYANWLRINYPNLDSIYQDQNRVLIDSNYNRASIHIPIAFHVIYNNSAEQLNVQKLQEAINILNQDFTRQNPEASSTGDYGRYYDGCNNEFSLNYSNIAANCDIDFYLHAITYDYTPSVSFNLSTNPNVLKEQFPYYNIYNPNCILNVWVATFPTNLLGWASFPQTQASNPQHDGITVNNQAIGYFSLNRHTLTHEVGHWLGLRHIWGDTQCGDDFVSDTYPQYDNSISLKSNPQFSLNTPSSCTIWTACPGTNIFQSCFDLLFYPYPYTAMSDNFMDYNDESCMNFFSEGQKQRIWYSINQYRPILLNDQNPCTVGIQSKNLIFNKYTIDPNPSESVISIHGNNESLNRIKSVHLKNIEGRYIFTNLGTTIDVSALPEGFYFIEIETNTSEIINLKFIKI